MFTLSVLVSALACASAFVPSTRVASSSLKMGFETEIGAQAPLGYWDPLGIMKDADQAKFDQWRTAEIKHGRVAMLAVLGHIVTTKGDRFPGDIAYNLPFSSMKNGVAVLETLPTAGLLQLIFFIGLMELGFSTIQKDVEAICVSKMEQAGWDLKKQNSKRAIELNNGRAAQMGILTLIVHEKLNNDPYIINSLLGAPVPFN